MNDKTIYRGERIETKMRGNPSITQIWVWNAEKRSYIDPRNIPGQKQKHFRAVKRVTVLGKKVKKSTTFSSLDEARAWRSNPENVADLKVVRSAQYRIQELIQEWREWTKPPRLEESTWEIYGNDLIHFALLADVPVEDLTDRDIDQWIVHLRSPKYPKSKGRMSFSRELKTLTVILNWYREYKNSRFQPPILRRHRKDVLLRKKPPRPQYALSELNLERCLERLKERHKPVYYYLASFQALCGARIGEACGLFWECVDFDRSTVEIKRVVRWDHVKRTPHLKDGTKTGEPRIIVMPPRLVDLLREWKALGAGDGLVFHHEGNLLRYSAIQNCYKKVYVALELPNRSTHVYRHSFASLHADQTKDIRATQAAMGHRDLRITQHYAKVAEQTQRNAVPAFRFGQKLPESSTALEKKVETK